MVRMIFQADAELVERTKRRATQRGVSVAQVVRDALMRELGGEERPPPVPGLGSLRSGQRDTARTAGDMAFEPPPWRSS